MITNLLFDAPYNMILKNDNYAKLNQRKTQREKNESA